MTKAWNPELKFFAQSYEDLDVVDSAVLVMPLVFFVPAVWFAPFHIQRQQALRETHTDRAAVREHAAPDLEEPAAWRSDIERAFRPVLHATFSHLTTLLRTSSFDMMSRNRTMASVARRERSRSAPSGVSRRSLAPVLTTRLSSNERSRCSRTSCSTSIMWVCAQKRLVMQARLLGIMFKASGTFFLSSRDE
jgi:hypothetical protein